MFDYGRDDRQVMFGLSVVQAAATLAAVRPGQPRVEVPVVVRLDTPIEIDYYRAGGILPYVLARILE